MRKLRFSSSLLALLIVATPGVSLATIDTVALYRLGEDDPGANPSNVGQNPTFDGGPNHLNLTRLGTPHYSADVGARGSTISMRFDPATQDDYYRTPLPTPPDNVGIEGWVKSSGHGTGAGHEVIAINGLPFASGFGLVRVEDGTPFGGLTPAYVGLLGSTAVGFTAVPDQQWIHLALVRDAGTTTFYVNGQAAGSTTAGLTGPTEAFSIGASYCATCARLVPTADYLNGLVDEVRVFTFQPGKFNPLLDLSFQPIPEPAATAVMFLACVGLPLSRRLGRLR